MSSSLKSDSSPSISSSSASPFNSSSVSSISSSAASAVSSFSASSPSSEASTSYAEGTARFPSSFTDVQKAYYAGVEGLKGQALFTKLREIVNKGFTAKTYGDAREGLKDIDEDPLNSSNIIEIYTQNSVAKSLSMFGNNDGYWNREHVFPKSRMGISSLSSGSTGRGADYHMLHASDGSINGARGSLNYYQFTGSEKFSQDLKTKEGYANLSKYSSTLGFEPIDEVKGDCARTDLYMVVKWPECSITNTSSQSSSTELGQLKWLISWNRADHVSSFEKTRNEKIYAKYQHNRNPFIDAPEWADLIWDENGFIS